MIRINLVQRKQASYMGDKTGAASGFSSLKSMAAAGGSGLMPLVGKLGLPVALCILTAFGYDFLIEQKTTEMAAEKAVLDQQKDQIGKELAKIKGFEGMKVELERNGLILRTKIDTIEKLIHGRDFTPKTLIALAQSMPSEAWLTELVSTENSFSLKGGAVDIGMISDLMSRLGKTIYFKDVSLKNTMTDPNGKQSVFELTARRE